MKRSAEPWPVYVSLCAWRSEALAARGEFRAALESARDGLRVADAIEHGPSRALSRAHLGYVSVLKGEPAAALDCLEQGLAVGEEADSPHGIGFNLTYLGYALVLLGRHPEGLAQLERALALGRTLGVPMTAWAKYRTVTASAYLAADRIDQARAEVDQGLALATTSGARGHEPPLWRLQAELLARQERPDIGRAVQCLEQGMAVAAELGMQPEVAHAHVGLGWLHRRAGDPRRAREHLQLAVSLLRVMDMPMWLEKAEADLRRVG